MPFRKGGRGGKHPRAKKVAVSLVKGAIVASTAGSAVTGTARTATWLGLYGALRGPRIQPAVSQPMDAETHEDSWTGIEAEDIHFLPHEEIEGQRRLRKKFRLGLTLAVSPSPHIRPSRRGRKLHAQFSWYWWPGTDSAPFLGPRHARDERTPPALPQIFCELRIPSHDSFSLHDTVIRSRPADSRIPLYRICPNQRAGCGCYVSELDPDTLGGT